MTRGRCIIRLLILIMYSPMKPVKNSCREPKINTPNRIGMDPAGYLDQKINFRTR